jgi:N-acyl-D-aspartate/D-glutamate deacylase
VALGLAACGGADYDVILRGGTVLDGAGGEPFLADVAVRGAHVVRVGGLGDARGTEEVDVSGLYVAPGFINLHSHDRLDAAPTSVNLLSQGVTTIILNADGGGPLDLLEQVAEAEAAGLAVNVGPNIGFNSAWTEVNGREDTRPSPDQLRSMRALVEGGLDAGAWGVSAGLDYKPTYYATTDEVVTVLSNMAARRTVFTNHDRLTPESGFSSRVGMQETIRIGEATGLMPVITHMKIQGREQGTSDAVLGMMSDATAGGTYTAADVYPYLAGQTGLAALIIPAWAQAGGLEAMRERFADPAQRAQIIVEANEAMEARFGGPEGVFLPATGAELVDVMRELDASSGGEAVVRILEEETPSAILRFGSEEDLAAILSHPTASIACDCDPAEGRVGHPRGYGTFPRALGRYVRELGVLSWEGAIRKMTGLPAATIGMVDRGLVAPGMVADLVVFDPQTITDHATYAEPDLPSEGIRHVMVNGTWALRDGVSMGVRAGRALLRTPNMPARPDGSGASRSVEISATFASDAGADVDVTLALQQGVGARFADGTISLAGPGAPGSFTVTTLGRLQTTEGWASVTGTAGVEDQDRTFLLIVDTRDPTVVAEGTTVVLWLDGAEALHAGSREVAVVR